MWYQLLFFVAYSPLWNDAEDPTHCCCVVKYHISSNGVLSPFRPHCSGWMVSLWWSVAQPSSRQLINNASCFTGSSSLCPSVSVVSLLSFTLPLVALWSRKAALCVLLLVCGTSPPCWGKNSPLVVWTSCIVVVGRWAEVFRWVHSIAGSVSCGCSWSFAWVCSAKSMNGWTPP